MMLIDPTDKINSNHCHTVVFLVLSSDYGTTYTELCGINYCKKIHLFYYNESLLAVTSC